MDTNGKSSHDSNALAIINEGKRSRSGQGQLDHPVMTRRGITIALATALVESNLMMYANYGDPDSLSFAHDAVSTDYDSTGLFQQRPKWWGSVADRMDPARSAALFFNALARLDYNDTSRSPGSFAQQVQQSAFPDRYDQHVAEAQELYDRLATTAVLAKKETMEKVLNYPRQAGGDYDGVAQQRSWDCGPASTQIILASCGISKTEDWLIGQIGTTVDGTNSAEYIVPILNRLLPGSGYTAVWLPKDPPSRQQIETLWANTVKSINAGRGVILNFEAPPNNFPRGTRGSTSPSYNGSNTIYHYTAGMGVAQDADGSRHIWVADPGFRPFGYWCSLEQVASLIVPHAYAYAATAPVVTTPVVSPPTPTNTPVTPSSDGSLAQLWREWNAVEYGDPAAIGEIVTAAKGGDRRCASALALLERANPVALQAFINSKGK